MVFVAFIFSKNESGGIGIFLSSFLNIPMKLTCSLVLLFDCFFRYVFQIIFPRFGVFSDCLERKKKKRDQFSRSRSNCRLLIATSAAIFPTSTPRDILPYSRSLIEIEDRDHHLWSIPYQFILNQVTSHISSEYGTQALISDAHTCTYIGEQLLLLL